MGATSKQRTPSRCRDWEKERRNKFNQAINKLGELIRLSSKQQNSSETETAQLSKIEIVQRAILLITGVDQEISKLKADILVLQVKLDSYEKPSNNEKKDASTQINKAIKTKLRSSKYNKYLMLKKCKNNYFKEKCPVAEVNQKSLKQTNTEEEHINGLQTTTKSKNLPKILPKTGKPKGAENTVVVVPATPYIIPQRPLLFPTTPPTYVLLNSNLQPLTKSSIPLINRSTNESTKTTMVNILPISAYSHTLSASKMKKNISKPKVNGQAKKKSKILKVPTKPKEKSGINVKAIIKSKEDEVVTNSTSKNNNDKIIGEAQTNKTTKDSDESKANSTSNDSNGNVGEHGKLPNTASSKEGPGDPKLDKTDNSKLVPIDIVSNAQTIKEPSQTNIDKSLKSNLDKVNMPSDKNKLENILDSSLCDNTVDTGNARLELAEELLADSPTAAFLMSFPLVSGNRADSPIEEPQNTTQNIKENLQRKIEATPQNEPFYHKATSDVKNKTSSKIHTETKNVNNNKFSETNSSVKSGHTKTSNVLTVTNAATENPFLSLSVPSVISTSCPETTFSLDFDCNLAKPLTSQSTSYCTSSNFFYKSDAFNSVKNPIYSTSSISSGHDFNSLSLYPCAMEKFSSKTKSDYPNVEDNLMKIGSSRLTYDVDLGWSHKGFDFVNCTTGAPTFSKDNLLTTSSTSYNPFNPEFHVPLVTHTTKKDTSSKPSSSFVDTIANYYSQTTNLWSEEVPFYTSNSLPTTKAQVTKHSYTPLETTSHSYTAAVAKPSTKQYTKSMIDISNDNVMKSTVPGMGQHNMDKYTKKSPSKMLINWMTSETRPQQPNCNPIVDIKEQPRNVPYGHIDTPSKKQEQGDGNYFPISIHNYSSHAPQEEFQIWPAAARGPTEVSIDPPPINLPTLVGDLALGPHDKKKNAEATRAMPQTDIHNFGNFLSVTQLMNRTDNAASRCLVQGEQAPKQVAMKPNNSHYSADPNRKTLSSRLDTNVIQPCYSFNDPKPSNSYDVMNPYSVSKQKSVKLTDKTTKHHKNSYSAEALIRGAPCTQKIPENKYAMSTQKYNECNSVNDSSVAQVSHFPPILEYPENAYAGQQFSGTTLYNSTTNTISNSFYSNFMPGSSNLMSSNYAGTPFTGEFIDYNQTAECNYSNQKYEEFKMKSNVPTFHHEKTTNNPKSSRRDYSAAKHKLDYGKKESKKYQSKRSRVTNEAEEWSEANLLWQNKTTPTKRHPNLVPDDLSFPNYMSNQMPSQYQPDIFNSHLMPNMQTMSHNGDRSLASLPATSRANFNLSTIFPEITMKVQ